MSSTFTRYTATQPLRRASKQKLKSSCDTCASLKIASHKQQPDCERCLSNGRRCTYSLACRDGKSKQSKLREPAVSLQSPSERLICPTPSSLAPTEDDEYLTSGCPATNNSTTIPELPEAVTTNSSGLRSSLTDGLCFTTINLPRALGKQQPTSL